VCVYRDNIFSTSCNIGKLCYWFYGAIFDSYRENIVTLGGGWVIQFLPGVGKWQCITTSVDVLYFNIKLNTRSSNIAVVISRSDRSEIKIFELPPPCFTFCKYYLNKGWIFLRSTIWNTRRCSGFKIKWKNSSDMFVAGFWIVATPNLVGIG
jgi:hypothetical protein